MKKITNKITVLAEGNKQHRVRLQHIDCPEIRQPFATKGIDLREKAREGRIEKDW